MENGIELMLPRLHDLDQHPTDQGVVLVGMEASRTAVCHAQVLAGVRGQTRTLDGRDLHAPLLAPQLVVRSTSSDLLG